MSLIGFVMALDWAAFLHTMDSTSGDGLVGEAPGLLIRIIITGLFVAFLLRPRKSA
jgi:hypothetical protein